VTEEFRWGEFTDSGETVLDGPSTYNQIFFAVPVNPRRILSFAKINTIGSTDPMIYKSEPDIQNSYQYEIEQCSIEMTCVVPETVSFTLAMFVTPNLESVIDSTSVMNIYASLPKSARREISVKGSAALTFRSGRAYIKDDPLDSQFDPRLCFGGYIVAFLKAPCVAGLDANGSRSYLGPVCTVSLQSTITYYGFQYNGSQIATPELYVAVENEVVTTNNGYHVYSSNYTYELDGVIEERSIEFAATMVSVSIPEALEVAVQAASETQQMRGELIGTTGDYKSFVTSLSLGPRPTWAAATNTDLGVNFDTATRTSIADGLKSAFAYIKDIPQRINVGLVSMLGKSAGDLVYKVGSNMAMLGLKFLVGLRDGGYPVSPPLHGGWTSLGEPFVYQDADDGLLRAPASGWMEPGSPSYEYTLENLPDEQKSVAAALAADPDGPQPMIWTQCIASYFTKSAEPFVGGPAYIGRTAIVAAWELILTSGPAVKASFGQPLAVSGGHNIIEPRLRSHLITSYTARQPNRQLHRRHYGLVYLEVRNASNIFYLDSGPIAFGDLPNSVIYSTSFGGTQIIMRDVRITRLSTPNRPSLIGTLRVDGVAGYSEFAPYSAVNAAGLSHLIKLANVDYILEFPYFEEQSAESPFLRESRGAARQVAMRTIAPMTHCENASYLKLCGGAVEEDKVLPAVDNARSKFL